MIVSRIKFHIQESNGNNNNLYFFLEENEAKELDDYLTKKAFSVKQDQKFKAAVTRFNKIAGEK